MINGSEIMDLRFRTLGELVFCFVILECSSSEISSKSLEFLSRYCRFSKMNSKLSLPHRVDKHFISLIEKKMCACVKRNISCTEELKLIIGKCYTKSDKFDNWNKVDYFLTEHKASKLFKPVVMKGIENLWEIYYLKEHWASYQLTTHLDKIDFSDII